MRLIELSRVTASRGDVAGQVLGVPAVDGGPLAATEACIHLANLDQAVASTRRSK